MQHAESACTSERGSVAGRHWADSNS